MALPSLTLLGQSLLSGLFIGALYGLLGLGLSLSWGMLRQINLAHFALAFLGAYLTYQLAGAGMDPLATLAVVMPCFFALGVLMHWLLARFSVSAFNSLLVSFGFTAIIEALIQWIWTADFRRMESAYGEVKFRVGALYVALPELLTLAMAVALSLLVWAWLRHTYTGKAMRAIAEDAPIAAAFGVDVRGLSLLLSGLSAAFAGVAGLCLALSYTLAPGQIYAWLGVVFAAVMLGGLGNPLGPLVAGIVIGVSEALTMAFTAPAWAPLVSKAGVPFLWTLPLAALVAAAFGIALGAVVFRLPRLRGELFALLTLAVTFVLATIVLNTPIDGGPGLYLSAVPLPAIGPSPSSTFYLLGLALALATLWIAREIQRSKLGTGLFAIHDAEDVAEVLGVPTYRYKLAAFGVSCGLAGVAGGIQAMFISYVTVGETFSIALPLNVVLMSLLGGSRHWSGPAVGAAAVTALLYPFTAGDYGVAGRAGVGMILILVILFLPEGIFGQAVRALERGRVSAARGIDAADLAAPTAAPPGKAEGETLLEARGLSKAFRGVQALAGVDPEGRRGEILGLVGPNGSGKSTLINVVSGHFRPDSGRILFEGRDLAALEAHRTARTGPPRTHQTPRPFPPPPALATPPPPPPLSPAPLAHP